MHRIFTTIATPWEVFGVWRVRGSVGSEIERYGSGFKRVSVGSGRVKKRVGLDRRTGWGSGGQAQMSEDLGNHRWIYDGGDNRQGAATLRTGCDVDLKGTVFIPHLLQWN